MERDGNPGLAGNVRIPSLSIPESFPASCKCPIPHARGTDLSSKLRECTESEKSYHDLIELSPDPIILHGEGKFIYLNPAALTLYRAAHPDEIVGKNVLDHIHPDDREAIRNRIEEVYRYKSRVPLRETKILRLDGSVVDVETTGARLVYRGKPAMQVILRDITVRKQAEIALQRHAAELEEMNRELDSFSYSVAHDLRAPLRIIDFHARTILKAMGDSFPEEVRPKFDAIRYSAKTMNNLIEDLLAFSHLGKKSIVKSALDMEELVRDVWQELKAGSPERTMTLTANSLLPGHGERQLIRQVYANLLTNAVKFTRNREEACIETGCCKDRGEHIYYVRDNGSGFDSADREKLFILFQRLGNAADTEGTGAGLAIVDRIIRRHGGRVWAEGKIGEGATFFFALPEKEKDLSSEEK